MFETDLIKPQPVAEMVDCYHEASTLIERAYLDLEIARKMLSDTFGEQAYIQVVDRQQLEFGEKGYAHIRKEIKKRIWIQLVRRLDIRRFLSVKRSEDLSRQLEKNEMPDITTQAVYETIETLRQNSPEFVREAVVEVFELLRPGSRKAGASLKTNLKNGRFAVGKKVILSGYLEQIYASTRMRCNHKKSDELRSIDRVFHALDGKGMTDGYLSPLMDAIEWIWCSNLINSLGTALCYRAERNAAMNNFMQNNKPPKLPKREMEALIQELKELREAAEMGNWSVSHFDDDINPTKITEMIKEKTRSYRESYLIRPLEELISRYETALAAQA